MHGLKIGFLVVLFSIVCKRASSQHIPIDTSVLYNWPVVSGASISNDGRYVAYTIDNVPKGNQTLVIRSIFGDWERQTVGATDFQFTNENRTAIYILNDDTLCTLALNSRKVNFVPNVNSYQLLNKNKSQLLIYTINNLNKDLVICDLVEGTAKSFKGVDGFWSDIAGGFLVIIRDTSYKKRIWRYISLVDLRDKSEKYIWQGINADNIIFDYKDSQIAFIGEDSIDNSLSRKLYLYRYAGDSANEIIDTKVSETLFIDNLATFSKDGSRIMVGLREKKPITDNNMIGVDVWSYTDPKLQSEQLWELSQDRTYLGYLALNDPRRIIQIENKEIRPVVAAAIDKDFIVLESTTGDISEGYWAKTGRPKFSVISLKSKQINSLSFIYMGVSPGGRFIIGRDFNWRDYFVYDVKTGIERNITENIPILSVDNSTNQPILSLSKGLNPVAWEKDDSFLIMYDRFDIWKVDPLGKRKPINLTNGYGKKHSTIFRLANVSDGGGLDRKDSVIVSAFEDATKDNGFYQVSLSGGSDPKYLAMCHCAYYAPTIGVGIMPLKARDTDVYVLLHQRVDSSPNYYWTKNFVHFYPISHVYPEISYVWLKSKLCTFPTLDGSYQKGVLYMPNNFDNSKIYPAIIHFYEVMSDDLNKYQMPVGDYGDLNIAWFVSHGYIVFTPDIHYKIGSPGESALNSVLGAADYLGHLAFIAKNRLGIQGHSFGGYEANYIVTHSHIFAAAISSAGVSDIVSSLVDFDYSGGVHYELTEYRQFRMGATIWNNPSAYIKNSPIYSADKVSTPLLIVNNKNDHNVGFDQGLELFCALRRLGKRVWMLQYDNALHGLAGIQRTDCLLRSDEFFDHYLTGIAAPVWMTRGIPASLKGIDLGLELDLKNREPGSGILMQNREKR